MSQQDGAPSQEFEVVKTATASGTAMAVGVITAGDLRDHYFVPRRDSRNRTGYQREVSPSRVNRLMKDLKDRRVDLPTSVLVNIRNFDPLEHLSERDGKIWFRLNGDKLHVVDGQHRIEALSKLVEDDASRWSSFEIPFVCLLGASEKEEMRQFYVVNSTAKSVRTDLALDLLKQQAESDPNILDSLIETGDAWKVKAQTLVEELVKDSPIWRSRIRFPSDPKAETTIGSAGMVASLKSLLATPYFSSISTPNQVKVLDAYWKGIQKVIPEVFLDPSEYAIQKSTGAMIMHTLLISVLEYVRSAGRSVIEPEPYADALSDVLLNLQGDTRNGGVAQGPEFWLAGGDGAAGSYSSNAGRRVLGAKLKGVLPEIEVE